VSGLGSSKLGLCRHSSACCELCRASVEWRSAHAGVDRQMTAREEKVCGGEVGHDVGKNAISDDAQTTSRRGKVYPMGTTARHHLATRIADGYWLAGKLSSAAKRETFAGSD
jgi:hypothetical protein